MNSKIIRNLWLAIMFLFIGLGFFLYKKRNQVIEEPAVELVAPVVESTEVPVVVEGEKK